MTVLNKFWGRNEKTKQIKSLHTNAEDQSYFRTLLLLLHDQIYNKVADPTFAAED